MELVAETRLSGAHREAWLGLWQVCPQAHPRQHPAVAELERSKGRRTVYLMGWRGPHLMAAGALSVKSLWADGAGLDGVFLRGPMLRGVSEGTDFIRLVIGWARRARLGRIRLAPFWRYPDAKLIEGVLSEHGFRPVADKGVSASTGIIDLRRGADEILKGFSSSARYQIRLAERVGVRVEPVAACGDRAFFDCFRQMQAENGIPRASWSEFAEMQAVFTADPSLGVMLEARKGGVFLGGLWVFRAPLCAIPTKYAVVKRRPSDSDSSVSIGPTLFWEAVRWAKSKGCTVFDVDGYRPDLSPNHPCHAACEFKKRLRPEPSSLLPEHFRITSPVVDRLGTAAGKLARARLRLTARLARRAEPRRDRARAAVPAFEQP